VGTVILLVNVSREELRLQLQVSARQVIPESIVAILPATVGHVLLSGAADGVIQQAVVLQGARLDPLGSKLPAVTMPMVSLVEPVESRILEL
jgi:hypothetical protein